MTAITCEKSMDAGGFFGKIFLGGLLLAILAIGLMMISHAVERHQEEVAIVYSCLEKNGTLQTWTKPGKFPGTKRTAYVCLLEDGHQAIQILDEEGEEVTAFIRNWKNKIPDTMQQFAHYMRSSFWDTCVGLFCF